MADISEDLEGLFLAGIGIAAYAAEQGKQLADELTAKGKVAVSQNQKLNSELQHNPEATSRVMREIELEARMRAMTPEERCAYAEAAARFAHAQNAEAVSDTMGSVFADEITRDESFSAEDSPSQASAASQDISSPID